jgi:hypothetical protein
MEPREFPVRASQRATEFCREATAIVLPSGETATQQEPIGGVLFE